MAIVINALEKVDALQAGGADLVFLFDKKLVDEDTQAKFFHIGVTTVEQFAARGFATVQETAVTWRRRPFVLDHIFHNPALRCIGHQVAPTLASDHHVITADFEFSA